MKTTRIPPNIKVVELNFQTLPLNIKLIMDHDENNFIVIQRASVKRTSEETPWEPRSLSRGRLTFGGHPERQSSEAGHSRSSSCAGKKANKAERRGSGRSLKGSPGDNGEKELKELKPEE